MEKIGDIKDENLKAENIALAAVYNILFTNDIVCSLIIDFTSVLENNRLYKQNVKKLSKKLIENINSYEKKIFTIVGKRALFFADANSVFSSNVMPDIQKLEYSIKYEFDKNKIENAQLLSKLEVARVMASLACLSLDKRIEEVVPYNRDVKNLTYLRLTNTYKLIDNLSELLYKGKYVNLNDSQNCKLAVSIIEKKLVSCLAINRAITESEELNPVND